MRKKIESEEEGGSSASWLTTFNDLMTNLMVFFVLLFTLSSLDLTNAGKISDTFQSAIGVLNEGRKLKVGVVEPREHAVMNPSPEVEEHDPHVTVGERSVSGAQTDELKEVVKALDSEAGVAAMHSAKGVLITIEDRVLFATGKGEINPEGLPVLDRILQLIAKLPNPIRVEGHTDNVPIHTRRFPSNWELSVARAVNVVKYFVDRGGVEPGRLSAVGYGEINPLVPNDKPVNRSQNRRVEIVLVMKEAN
ncbi:MAG: flagellar motor protein MotB [Desulfobacterales bacterium]|nr:flagellar motor protein MotB [Desulfobacterales bacterium]